MSFFLNCSLKKTNTLKKLKLRTIGVIYNQCQKWLLIYFLLIVFALQQFSHPTHLRPKLNYSLPVLRHLKLMKAFYRKINARLNHV